MTPNHQSPLISVLLPVRNGAQYLEQAIDSILNQSITDFEFIIVDDCSNDETPAILNRYALIDKRVKIHTFIDNMGVSAALNFGINRARGKYIARMDADDLSLPLRLEMQSQFLEAHSEIGLVGAAVQVIDELGVEGPIWKFPETHALVEWHLCYYSPFVHPVMMIRRELFEFEEYCEDHKQAQDYDLWIRLIWITKASNLPNVLLQLRKHEANISSRHYDEQKQVSARIQRDMINRVLEDDIAIEVIEVFKQTGSIGKIAFAKARHLVGRLYRKFQRREDLDKEELTVIKSDAIRRLMGLAGRRFPRVDSMSIFYHMFRIDVFLSLSMIFTWAKDKFRKG